MALLSSNVESKLTVANEWRPDVHRLATTVPTFGLPSWAQAATRCGFSVEAAFREAGIELDMKRPQGAQVQVPVEVLLKAIEACVRRSNDHYFPLALGDAFAFDHFPQLEVFLATSPTLRRAVEALPWIRVLQLPWLWVTLEESADEAALVVTLDPDMARRPEAVYLVEIILAACRKFAKVMLGRSLSPLSAPVLAAQFQRPRPDNAAVFHDFFPCRVQFGAWRNALVFPASILDVPLEGALPQAHEQARQAIERQLEATLPRFVSTEAVKQIFEDQPDLLKGGLDDAAEALGMHARTLQRRLQSEGFKFADLQAQAKFARARQMLTRKAISMEIISIELGFSDRRAFTYAFKRWAGLSPSSYRAQILMASAPAAKRP